MVISGWGRYKKIDSDVLYYTSEKTLREIILKHDNLIPIGNLRSYGDCVLSDVAVSSIKNRFLIEFNEKEGILSCKSGVLLKDIIEVFVPRGWFLPVTPGTKYITVGGAISSDVHGKNHHIDGCISEFVEEIEIMLPDGTVQKVKKGDELFKGICGGMGLLGVILQAKIRLKKIRSKNIIQRTIRTKTLEEIFQAFEKNRKITYSVAWIDALNLESRSVRGLVMIGEFSEDGDLSYPTKSIFNIRIDMPSFILNNPIMRAFNSIYYLKAEDSDRIVDIDSFFYPLDRIEGWNRLYGKKGFIQYQFIVPKKYSFDAIDEVLKTIKKDRVYPFLSVLKLYGRENNNFLSFPLEGYSLALDFKVQTGLLDTLSKLDKIVLKYGGRIYLAKDTLMSREMLETGYIYLDKFRNMRKELGAMKKFSSIQSRRLGL
ncbi:MAG: FAD-binding oxidoreductase [Hydrogenothermaceae bacterium]|nr:FAD-binding oxidoreductase [Hydrogenothermaceae bacterium]